MQGRFNFKTAIVYGLFAIVLSLTFFSASVRAEKNPDQVTLKVALLPIFDAFPFYVAEAGGFFESARIKIIGLPVGSGLERDQLLQAGEIDGVLNEMTTVAGFNRNGSRVKVVSVARHPAPGHPLFRLLAAPGSGISSTEDVAGIPIAVSTNTIIEYVTDRLLTAKGLEPEQIVKKSVPVIPERYQLLMEGQIKAAVLPDPLAASALLAGAGLIFDDTDDPGYSVSVLTFTVEAIDRKAEAIRFFLKGWDRAAAAVNQDPQAYRELLLKKIRVPKNMRQNVAIPPFPRGKVPSPGQWADVQDWMLGKGLLEAPLPYETSVTDLFLP